eukprot:TRINITY_DN8334_c0_g3_i1.p1 TRINITY_DN8334_c0_g3~~TRINITY_DN8334_c0_g3_i1.p1  ORF type:complete len:404 (+),score=24.59 TRINITY_DN8334_c0_g3_i1:27-1214(+)
MIIRRSKTLFPQLAYVSQKLFKDEILAQTGFVNFNSPWQSDQECQHNYFRGRSYHFSKISNLGQTAVQNEEQEQPMPRACMTEDEILQELHSCKVYPTDMIAVKLAMYNSYVGVVMGRNGSFANRFNKVYGVNLTITPKGVYFPGVRKRLVEFKGQAVKVMMALSEAVIPMQEFALKFSHQALESATLTNLDEQTRGFHLVPFMPHKLIGYAIGERGAGLRELEKKYNVLFRIGNDQASLLYSRDRLVDIEGQPANILRTIISIIGTIQGGPTYQRFVDTNLLAHSEAMWFFENNRMMDENKYFANSIVETSMPVPRKYYGMLMGAGNQAMRDIYEFSRAEINLHNSPPPDLAADPLQTVIQIRGNFREVMRAMAMIASKLQAQEDNDRYYYEKR